MSRLLRPHRPGMVMMAALVIVALVALVAAVCATQFVQLRRQSVREAAARQAQWLATGALGRAQAALRQDATYRGETWSAEIVAATANAEALRGTVVILVEELPNNLGKRITIDARFPDDPQFGVRQQLSAIVPSAQTQP